MKARRTRSGLVAALCAVGLLCGAAVSPASAMAGLHWGHIWKKDIKPRADKRYYTKKKADARFSVKSALLGYYTKAESDAKYATPGSVSSALSGYLTGAQSDARYAPYPAVIRGAFIASGTGGPEYDSAISFVFAFTAAPTAHFINAGASVPAGCSGTVDNPDAAPGNLCIFEQGGANQGQRSYVSEGVQGGYVSLYPTTTGFAFTRGTWAARPTGFASTARTASSSQASAPQ